MTQNPPAMFRESAGWFHPTPELTRGPWRPDAMHGGPPSALVGWAITGAVEPGEHVARITIDLEAPVPIEPLRIVSTRRQVSRRVAHVAFSVLTERGQVCSAQAVLLRSEPLPTPVWTPDWDLTVPGPGHRVAMGPAFHGVPGVFHVDAVEHRVTAGAIDQPGPCVSWVGLTCGVIDGHPTPPLCTLLAVADFGSAIAQPLGSDESVALINVDVCMGLSRRPVGDWFRLDSHDLVGSEGIGLAITQLADHHGPLGVLHQSQLGSRR